MEQRISVITLGVRDLARARAFYEALGWQTNAGPDDDVVFFQAGPMVLSLWDRAKLAEDTGHRQDTGGWGGITPAHNVGSPEEVDEILAAAQAAGGEVPRPGGKTFWGGYSGVFVDPEGHGWEIGYNPHWTLAEDGSVTLAADGGGG
jgi:uncharacterized protein